MVYLSEKDIKSEFNPQTFARGWHYQKTGKVKKISVSAISSNEYLIEGTVQGSRKNPYEVFVEVTDNNLRTSIFSECSCPFEIDCKHAVAILIEAIKGNHFKQTPVNQDEIIKEGWLKNLSKTNLSTNDNTFSKWISSLKTMDERSFVGEHFSPESTSRLLYFLTLDI